MSMLRNTAIRALCLSTACIATSGWAQTEPHDVTTTTNAQGSGIGDIVVTARRRAESIQDVPLAVLALGEAAIEKGGIVQVSDIARITPNVAIATFNIGESQVYIRGVGTQTDSVVSESSVTISVDDVAIGRGGAPSIAFLDVGRVEVLRGPQGTLYGRNASAGTISFYSNRPTDRFGGSVEGSYGSFNTWGVKGIVNAPLSDGVAIRAAAQYSDSDGYAKNVITGKNLQGGERYGGRLQLQAKHDDWTFLVSADYSKDDLTGDSRYIVAFPGAVPPIVAAANALQASYAGDVWKSSGINGTYQRRTNYGFMGRVEYEADWATLTSITAYRNNKYGLRADYGGVPLPFPLIVADMVNDKARQFTQELRLNSNSSSKIQWVAGLFYYTDKVARGEEFNVTARSPLPAAFGGDNTAFQDGKSTSYAAFGQATLPFARIFELTLGARISHDKKDVFQQLVHNSPAGQGVGFPFFPGSPYAVSAKKSFTEPTWRATLAAEPWAGKNFYLSYDRGYKSGTFTSQAQNATQATSLIKPEKLDSFDVGMKTQWLNNVLRVNADAFYLDYRGLQVFEFGSSLNFVLSNADATVKGLEIQTIVAPSRFFNAGVTASYQDAKFTSNPTFAGATLLYKGNRLAKAPKEKVGLFGEVTVPVAGGRLIGRANYEWQSSFYYNPSNEVASLQNSYGVLGGYLSWETDSNLKFSLTGTNLTNTKYSVHSITLLGTGLRIFAPPRAVTFAVSKKF